MSARPSGWLLAAALIGLAACERSLDQPADPVWGKEPCAHCAMVVTEPASAAQLTTADGRRVYFDDVGCLVAYVADAHPTIRRAWAHDARSASWHDVREARYEAGARTPMDFGFVAHAPTEQGLAWDEVERRVLRRLADERAR